MSYYQGSSYRPGGDLYRPSSRPGNYSSQGYHQNRRHDRADQGSHYSSSNSNSSSAQHGHANYRQGNTRPKNNGPHQVYSQTQAENQLWMGDLDPRWTEQDIADIWTQMGETPVATKIMRDKTGKPQYCFVTFSSLSAVASAILKNRMRVPGSPRVFKLNWASGSTQGHGQHHDLRAVGGRQAPGARSATEYSVFVGDLGSDVTEEVLFARFDSEFPGAVKQVKIMTDVATGASKGFGFVRFLDPDAQQKSLTVMSGALIGNRQIRIGVANGATAGEPKTKKGETAAVSIPQLQPALGPATDPNNTVLVIRGITSDITREDLLAHFLSFGNIIYCRIDHSTAHIKYLLRGSAERALLYMHGFTLCGSRIVIRWGSEEVSGEKVRFLPVGGKATYRAAEAPPPVYGQLAQNVVFELLSLREAEALEFEDASELYSVDKLNEAYVQKIKNREALLELAF